ncbi:unnamed protein product [Timema podura]|uniref:Secreted protein n=1 Tax=Timema podura TaxID=61482 RepID=A0ABN7PD18_TIMPD|nr:unnamed protein product [Timema podura]
MNKHVYMPIFVYFPVCPECIANCMVQKVPKTTKIHLIAMRVPLLKKTWSKEGSNLDHYRERRALVIVLILTVSVLQ